MIISLSLEELRQLWREEARRYADLLNQGFRNPAVEKVTLLMTLGGFSTEDQEDPSTYKAQADDDMLRIDGPRHTAFIHAADRLEGVQLTYRRERAGQYL